MLDNFWAIQIGYYDNLNHTKIEKKLIKKCFVIKNTTESGGKNWLSNNTYNTSDSKFDIVKDNDFKEVNFFVNNCVKQYIQETGLKFKPSNFDGWFNIYEKHNYQEVHNHSPAIISVIYFLKSTKNSSKVFFYSPHEDHLKIHNKDFQNNLSSSVYYDPIPGRVLVFRSFLKHSVEQLTENKNRITLAYNFY